MRTKIKKSFATYYDDETNEEVVDVNELVQILSKGLGNIPSYLCHAKVIEIHTLALIFIELTEVIRSYEKGITQ